MIVRPFLEELKDEHKRYFESKLAALALKNQLGQFDSVSKVSGIVLQLLRDNKEIAMLRIDQDPRIQQQLYGLEFYGHLAKLSESMTKEQIYTQLLDSLQNQNTELSCILLIHAIFIHYFYDHFNHESASKKGELCKTIFPDKFFKDRGRLETNYSKVLTTSPGINRNTFFKKKLNIAVEQHFPALNRFVPDKSSEHYNFFSQKGIPFVAGPSGHMGSFILGALLYGNLNAAEFHEYVFACSAFMVSGGNHSLYECLLIANQLAPFYQVENYENIVPAGVKQFVAYQDLISEFSGSAIHDFSLSMS